MFFPTTCHKCGATDEARFILGSVHLKQVCNKCGAYIKFFDKSLMPSVVDIRLKIWFISNQNKELIEQCKIDTEYVSGMKGLAEKYVWWKVYLQVLKQKNNGISNIS